MMPEIAADLDPSAVFYVFHDVRNPKDDSLPPEKLILQASATALSQLLLSEDKDVQDSLKQWFEGRIRKIVKRAKGISWDKVAALDVPHFKANFEGVEVMVFAPMRVSQQPKELKKLQVSGLDSEDKFPANLGNRGHRCLNVTVDEKLGMTTGKLTAQVGHAVQLFMMYANESSVQRWLSHGSVIKVTRSTEMPDVELVDIVVHDAGLTEVPSGSLTATAKYIN